MCFGEIRIILTLLERSLYTKLLRDDKEIFLPETPGLFCVPRTLKLVL